MQRVSTLLMLSRHAWSWIISTLKDLGLWKVFLPPERLELDDLPAQPIPWFITGSHCGDLGAAALPWPAINPHWIPDFWLYCCLVLAMFPGGSLLLKWWSGSIDKAQHEVFAWAGKQSSAQPAVLQPHIPVLLLLAPYIAMVLGKMHQTPISVSLLSTPGAV